MRILIQNPRTDSVLAHLQGLFYFIPSFMERDSRMCLPTYIFIHGGHTGGGLVTSGCVHLSVRLVGWHEGVKDSPGIFQWDGIAGEKVRYVLGTIVCRALCMDSCSQGVYSPVVIESRETATGL